MSDIGGIIDKRIFFIADTHFNDRNIIRYTRRPFSSLLEMDNQLIINWNEVVGDLDTVFVLGDFFSGTSNKDFSYMCSVMEQLNGEKILVMGNHDDFGYHRYINAGFSEVYKYPIIYKDYIILSHYPVYVTTDTPYINLFGHVHISPTYVDVTTHSMCVSVERNLIGYKPISYEDIKAAIQVERDKIGMD